MVSTTYQTHTNCTLLNILQPTKPQNTHKTYSIYNLRCKTYNQWYVHHTNRDLTITYHKFQKHIRNRNPKLAYAVHILNNKHKYEPLQETIKLLKECIKGQRINCWETYTKIPTRAANRWKTWPWPKSTIHDHIEQGPAWHGIKIHTHKHHRQYTANTWYLHFTIQELVWPYHFTIWPTSISHP
jgi:hypothetical protein